MTISIRKTLIVLLCLLAVSILVTMILINIQPDQVLRKNIELSNINTPRSGGAVQASFPYYDSYDTADKATDLIVIGDVVKVNPPEELVTGEATNTITGNKVSVGHMFIVSEIEVSKVIKGKCTPGEIIKVKQLFQLSDETIFQLGERHIFFLQCYENGIPCSTINPQQGNVRIVDGKIRKTNDIQLISNGVPEDTALEEIKERIEYINNNKGNSITK